MSHRLCGASAQGHVACATPTSHPRDTAVNVEGCENVFYSCVEIVEDGVLASEHLEGVERERRYFDVLRLDIF